MPPDDEAAEGEKNLLGCSGSTISLPGDRTMADSFHDM
jgi:hypothetical protein